MALATKKQHNFKKLADFVAHGANVTCLALGHKSGCVLVTGGDDRKVNLWAVGTPKHILSLSGHSSAVQCVRFGHTESQVCAGSIAGALKTWDLEANCVLRNLSGHKGSIRAIEFHPYGDFITSGSSDTKVKLWDIRRKGCIFTYRGHSDAVNSLKFSPDGQWIASAGQEGIVKLWDLRMGKMLREFCKHSGPVSSIEFHPHEFLLASASQDNIINFWDLEQFTLVSSTNKELPNARCLHFSSGGEFLYAGATDTLRVFGWEPARTVNSMHIPWGNVQDIAAGDSKLIGASFHGTNVSLWVVDTTSLVQTDQSLDSSYTSPFSHGSSLRKSFNKQKPSPEAKKSLSVKTIEESERSGTDPEDEAFTEIPNMADYRAVFQPSRSLNRSPPICIYTSSPLPPVSPPTVDEDVYLMEDTLKPVQETVNEIPECLTATPTSPMSVSLVNVVVDRRRSISPQSVDFQRRQRSSREESMEQEPEFPVKLSSIHHSNSESNIPRAISTTTLHQHRSIVKHNRTPHNSNSISKPILRETKSDRGTPSVNTPQRVQVQEVEDFIPMPLDRPTGLDFDEFVPRAYQKGSQYSQTVPDMSEAEVLSSMMRGNESVLAILDARASNLQIFYSLWQNQDLKAAAEAAVNMSDLCITADFIKAIICRPNMWSLDICVIVLPAIHNLLKSIYESHMKTGCDALRLILKNFSPVIKTNVMSGPVALGVDIMREERYDKCIKCYNSLLDIRSFLLKRQTLQGPLGQTFRDLHISLQSIDSN